jgi:hypothetical protein
MDADKIAFANPRRSPLAPLFKGYRVPTSRLDFVFNGFTPPTPPSKGGALAPSPAWCATLSSSRVSRAVGTRTVRASAHIRGGLGWGKDRLSILDRPVLWLP